MIILGVDPGSTIVGYGVIDASPAAVMYGCGEPAIKYVECGVLRATGKDYADRIGDLAEALRDVVREHRPLIAVIERAYIGRNVRSGMVVAESRGAYRETLWSMFVGIAEMTPTEMKQEVTGTGAASKAQVSRHVMAVLGLHRIPAEDATDALGLAIAYARRQS